MISYIFLPQFHSSIETRNKEIKKEREREMNPPPTQSMEISNSSSLTQSTVPGDDKLKKVIDNLGFILYQIFLKREDFGLILSL